ncbi:hypothetical protein PIIN_09655 [Serendipita indica DSM 11827]|uniref:F-box domain-containing protein n=1 Tax=Serendipita indica (strain DSM 11827) TaxID=1109443 RepID=G4TWH2_SERID|nr:hypothetical protein PIIN_09655 [Serendipita indica DSM 11827]
MPEIEITYSLERMTRLESLQLPSVKIERDDPPSLQVLTSITSLTCSLGQYPRLCPLIQAPQLAALKLILQEERSEDISTFSPGDFEDLPINELISTLIIVVPLGTPDDIGISPDSEAQEEHKFIEGFQHFRAVSRLELEGRTLPRFLQILSTDHTSLIKLEHLVISNRDVEEGVLTCFLSTYYAIRQKTISLSFEHCTNLDEEAVQRLHEKASRSDN